MLWVIIGIIIIVFLLLTIPVNDDKLDNGTKNTGPIVSAALILLLLGALGTMVGILVGP